jgi:hypothetical protein
VHQKKKGKKARAMAFKAVILSVTREMAQPRMTQSARIKTHQQTKAKD